jgi:pimeloyl-ACP methyl ester carboxylesterase
MTTPQLTPDLADPRKALSRPSEALHHRNVVAGTEVMHVVEAGRDNDGPTCLLLHGWPESWQTWQELMSVAAPAAHMIAVDLPGIGASTRNVPTGSKAAIASTIHELIQALDLHEVILIGHDIGGMITYAYLRRYTDLRAAVIMDVPIPGVAPWDAFIRQPFLWHFAFHAIPLLPERLVAGQESEYFGYFYDLLSAVDGAPSAPSRAEQVGAYRSHDALTAGFDWYRSFGDDIAHNQRATAEAPVRTPLLYLRGAQERGGDIDTYADGLRQAAVMDLEAATVDAAGHFPHQEAPHQTWTLIADFLARHAA